MRLLLTGLNHKTAPLSIREKVAFRPEDLPRAFHLFQAYPDIRESAILSTCNRTEIYVITRHPNLNGVVQEYLSRFHEVPLSDLISHLYTKEDQEAAHHLFHVAAGLDSLVLGENQILGQVKQSFKQAQEARSLGTLLHRLFQAVIEAGKRVRRETALGENPGSVGQAAVDLAEQIFGDLKDKSVLVLGAGKMGKLVTDSLMESGVSKVTVCSRTMEHARALAQALGAAACPLEDLDRALLGTDIVIAATGSPRPILTRARLEPIMQRRRHASLFLIDIAVPRDVEAEAGQIENLYLYNLDDLQQIVEEANQAVRQELARAHRILEEELARFQAWRESLQVVPTIKALTQKMEEMKAAELQKVLAKFPSLSQRERNTLEILAHSLVNKILHQPLVRIKSLSNHPLSADYLELTRHLFGLEEKHD